jgi:hypothetical protein
MSLKKKQNIAARKAGFEGLLEKRLAYLAGKGVEPKRAGKDTIVRKIKADIKAMGGRLKFFSDNEKIAEEAAKAKAEKAAGPKEEKGAGKAEKAEKAAKPKKDGAEGGEKKPKVEKKPAEPAA